MKYYLIACLLLLLVMGCGQSAEQEVDQLFEKGLKHIADYDFENARAAFSKIAEIDPGNPHSFYGLGLVYEGQLQYYDALHEYVYATIGNPEFIPVSANQYRVFTWLGDYEEAAKSAARYDRLLPNDPGAKFLHSLAMIDIGKFARARSLAHEAADLGLSPAVANLVIARAYNRSHLADSAAMALEKAVSQPEESPEFCMQAANLFQETGMIDSAITLSRHAVELSANDPVMIRRHFHRALEHDYFFEARQTIYLIPDSENAKVTRRTMEFLYYLDMGNKVKASRAGVDVRRFTGNSITSLYRDIFGRIPIGDFIPADRQVSIIRMNMEQRGWYEQFQNYVNYILAINLSGYLEERANLAELQAVGGPWSELREVKLKIVHLLWKTGHFDETKRLIDKMEKTYWLRPSWLTGIAGMYNDPVIRDYDKAERLYRQALKSDKWYRPAFEDQLNMYLTLNRLDDALKMFDQYPHLEESCPEITLMKALVLAENERIQSAMTVFENAIGQVRGNLQHFEDFIDVLKRKGGTEKILRVRELLVELGADNADALTMAAEQEADRGEFGVALGLAEKALAIDPDCVTALVQKARALFGTGKRSEAIDIFEDIRQKDWENTANNYAFSRILAEEKIDVVRACALAKTAALYASTDLKILMNISYAYFQAGRYDFSRGAAQTACRYHPNQPEPEFRVGMAMLEEGNPEAREHLLKAIELGLSGEHLKKAQETLEKL